LGLTENDPGVWVDIPNVEGFYQVSNHSRIKSLKRTVIKEGHPYIVNEKILTNRTKVNYIYYTLMSADGSKITVSLHRLVGTIFIPNPENKPEINHKNGIKSDPRITNLEWATQSENRHHAVDTGLVKVRWGKDHPNYGKTGLKMWNAKRCKEVSTGEIMSYSEAARKHNTDVGTISRMLNGKTKRKKSFEFVKA